MRRLPHHLNRLLERSSSRSKSFFIISGISLWVLFSLSVAQGQDIDETDTTPSTTVDTLTSLSLSPVNTLINIDNCEEISADENFTLSGEYNQPSQLIDYHVRLIATTGSSCTHEDVCNLNKLDTGGCSCLREVSGTSSISTTFKVQDLFDEPCILGEEKTVSFFLHYTETEADLLLGGNPVEQESAAVKLSIDLNAPVDPSEAPAVTSAEEALVITVSDVGGDAVRYEACLRETGSSTSPTEGFDRCRDVTPGEGYRFEGLTNEIEYEVVYAVYDDTENRSGLSPLNVGTPIGVLDFAEVYSDLYPGGERGGCEAHPRSKRDALAFSPLFGVALFLGFALYLRRRIRERAPRPHAVISSTLCGIAILMSAALYQGEAHASPWETGLSERTSTISFLGASYMPSIDDEFEANTGIERPYERIFKNDAPLMFFFSTDRHLVQRFGTLSIGGGIGYWNVEGKGVSESSDDQEVNETTEMTIYPVSLHLSYRFDYFQNLIPLVPVVKGGLAYYMWNIYDGGGDVARFNSGEEASGSTFGWTYSIGAQFLLDFFDREMAWAFDRDAGVNHSYLSFEYQVSRVDDFGEPDSFRLGAEAFFFGIALDL